MRGSVSQSRVLISRLSTQVSPTRRVRTQTGTTARGADVGFESSVRFVLQIEECSGEAETENVDPVLAVNHKSCSSVINCELFCNLFCTRSMAPLVTVDFGRRV